MPQEFVDLARVDKPCPVYPKDRMMLKAACMHLLGVLASILGKKEFRDRGAQVFMAPPTQCMAYHKVRCSQTPYLHIQRSGLPYLRIYVGKHSQSLNPHHCFAHRFVCYMLHGLHGPPPSPSSMCRHKNCNNPKCLNPAHMHWGTHEENMADREASRISSKSKGACYTSNYSNLTLSSSHICHSVGSSAQSTVA